MERVLQVAILKPTYKPITIILGCCAVLALCVAYAYFIEPDRLVVRYETIAVKGWDPGFDGLTIVMIGDIHGGSRGADAEKLRQVVARTNAVQPDVIVLLGDYVSQTGTGPIRERALKMPVEDVAANLDGLTARYGVFAVLGNHDWWYDEPRVANALSAHGIRVLQNELAEISNGEQKLRILGLVDHMHITSWPGFYDEARKLAAPTDGTGDLIVLEHSPDVLERMPRDAPISPDLKLFLAAHTHGGQVWLPILGRPVVPSSFGQKFAYGHVNDRGVDAFITAGIGTSILPLRFMVPPEITVLTIRAGN